MKNKLKLIKSRIQAKLDCPLTLDAISMQDTNLRRFFAAAGIIATLHSGALIFDTISYEHANTKMQTEQTTPIPTEPQLAEKTYKPYLISIIKIEEPSTGVEEDYVTYQDGQTDIQIMEGVTDYVNYKLPEEFYFCDGNVMTSNHTILNTSNGTMRSSTYTTEYHGNIVEINDGMKDMFDEKDWEDISSGKNLIHEVISVGGVLTTIDLGEGKPKFIFSYEDVIKNWESVLWGDIVHHFDPEITNTCKLIDENGNVIESYDYPAYNYDIIYNFQMADDIKSIIGDADVISESQINELFTIQTGKQLPNNEKKKLLKP